MTSLPSQIQHILHSSLRPSQQTNPTSHPNNPSIRFNPYIGSNQHFKFKTSLLASHERQLIQIKASISTQFQEQIHEYVVYQYSIITKMQKLGVDDFNIKTVIGKGTYAKVCLVTRKKDDQVFALKILKKKYIIEKSQQNHIMTEKRILADINHPFLVKLYSSFQDDKKLYFLLEYCPGGELFSLLAAKDKLSQQHAKFYAAQIVLALGELHKHKVVYRDLKPENIIIDKTGYIKLTDFGLSKILASDEEKAKTICGTPEYLAPEIVKKAGHSVQVDWWCLGCLIYEMVTGFPPFHNQNRMKLFEQIVYCPVDVKSFSPKLQDLFKGLLNKDPSKRLGVKGEKQVREHPWFETIDFKALEMRKLKSPFTPLIKSKTDTANFDVEFTSQPVHSHQQSPAMQIGDQKFKNFSYEGEK